MGVTTHTPHRTVRAQLRHTALHNLFFFISSVEQAYAYSRFMRWKRLEQSVEETL